MNIICAQIVGLLSILSNVGSLQCKKKKNMMDLQLLANILFSLQYWLLNAFSATYMNLVTILRCLLYRKYNDSKKNVPIYLTIILIIISLIVGYISYDGLLSLIPTAMGITYIISSTSKNVKKYKIVYAICAVIWLLYNFKVKALIGMIGNVFEIISSITSIKNTKK